MYRIREKSTGKFINLGRDSKHRCGIKTIILLKEIFEETGLYEMIKIKSKINVNCT